MTEKQEKLYNYFLKCAKTYLSERGKDMAPMLLLNKNDKDIIVQINNADSGNDILAVLNKALKDIDPDFYIIHFLGWYAPPETYEKYKSLHDAPLDDKDEAIVQIMVDKIEGLQKSSLVQVIRFKKEEKNMVEFKDVANTQKQMR
jgi:hypothetical protein